MQARLREPQSTTLNNIKFAFKFVSNYALAASQMTYGY